MKAFVSSTSQDLADYRQAAFEVCNRLQIVPIGMEQFETMGIGATAASNYKLDDADVYVGIFANRYGYVEAGHDRSVTELEFDHAGARGIERLCFLSTAAAGLPASAENADKLAAFRTRVDSLVVRGTFGSSWEFKYLLYDGLLKWLFRQRGTSPLARQVFEPLFASYSRFAGRVEALDTVQQFIESPGSGCLVITAPAGYGKTALTTRIVERNRSIAGYHFFTTLYGSDGDSEFLSELFFVKSATEQMRLWQFMPYDNWTAPTTLSGWVAAYQQALTTASKEKHVLVLDGLDEVKTWSLRPYLMTPPADNLKVIATVRDVGQDWAGEFGFPRAHTKHLPLEGLTRGDVRDALRLAGKIAARFAETDALLDKVVAVTTPEGTVAGSDPLYVTFLADDIQSADVTEETLGVQPRRLEDYLSTWWQGIVAEAEEDSAAIDLLATLAVALGPVRADDLRALHKSLRRTLTKDPLDGVVKRLRRTVAGTERAGYSFAHPRFRDYVRQNPEITPYEKALRDYATSWKQHGGRYALEFVVEHLARTGADDQLFVTVLDPAFQSAQRLALGSARRTLSDLAVAVTRACDADRPLDALRCAAAHRRVAHGEGIAKEIFAALAKGQYETAGRSVQAYADGAKSSSVWVLALRCYLICAAAKAGDHSRATALVDLFARQLGLRYHGATHHAAALCDTLIATAVANDPALASEIGVDPAWAPQALAQFAVLPPGDPALPGRLNDVQERVKNLDVTLGEHNVSAVEFLDEERTSEYTMLLSEALISIAGDPASRGLVDRAIAALLRNPYPRYRDIGLVAIAIAAQAVPDWGWAAARIETILETGLEREGVTFTFDLAAQLVAEAQSRGIAAEPLVSYLDQAAVTKDRWDTAPRCASARAAAAATQGKAAAADALMAEASNVDGFAGYVVTHLLAAAARYCEFGESDQVATLGLVEKALMHAERVRDPSFASERKDLANQSAKWFTASSPLPAEVVAKLRVMPDADMRRAFKDLTSARWVAEGQTEDWGPLVVASLADATALDTVLGRLFGHAIRQHHAGARLLPDAALAEAVAICGVDIATSRPWALGVPVYG